MIKFPQQKCNTDEIKWESSQKHRSHADHQERQNDDNGRIKEKQSNHRKYEKNKP